MPPNRDWPTRILDILDQARLVVEQTAGLTWEEFASDQVMQGNVLYRIGVIGEAVAAIPEDVKTRHPEVPWRDIRNMRNVVTHVYFGVDLARVWSAVRHDMPQLIVLVEGVGLAAPG